MVFRLCTVLLSIDFNPFLVSDIFSMFFWNHTKKNIPKFILFLLIVRSWQKSAV